MITDEQFERIAALWSMLQSADAQIVRQFRQHSVLARIPAGKTIFEPGDPVETISLLLSGGVRILAGIALIALGPFGIQGTTGIIVSVIGVVLVLAGLVNVCLIAPLIGAPFSGSQVLPGIAALISVR